MCKERCLFTWTGMTVKLQLPFCFSHYIPKPRLWFRTFTLLCLLVKCIKLKMKKKITFKIHFFLGNYFAIFEKKKERTIQSNQNLEIHCAVQLSTCINILLIHWHCKQAHAYQCQEKNPFALWPNGFSSKPTSDGLEKVYTRPLIHELSIHYKRKVLFKSHNKITITCNIFFSQFCSVHVP